LPGSIIRPQVTWRLDQKIIDALQLSSEQMNRRERTLREFLAQAVPVDEEGRGAKLAGVPVDIAGPLLMKNGRGASATAVFVWV
jgi:hypothetical protein